MSSKSGSVPCNFALFFLGGGGSVDLKWNDPMDHLCMHAECSAMYVF